jgi:glycosyltransferase involved in cell wall biosynthesis
MKILLYAHDWLPTIGGVQTITMSLARGLAEAACDVTVVTETPAGGMDDAALPFGVVRRPGVFHLASLIREADVVHIGGPCFLPLLIGQVLRKAVVVEHHGYAAVCPVGTLYYEPGQCICPGHFALGNYLHCVRCSKRGVGFLRGVLQLLLMLPRRVLCGWVGANVPITEHVLRRVGLPSSTVIYYGVDDVSPAVKRPGGGVGTVVPFGERPFARAIRTGSEAVCPSVAGRSPGPECVDGSEPSGEPPAFAFVGRLTSEKGVDVLLKATRIVREAGRRFVVRVIGDGPERGRLEVLAKACGVSEIVWFAGFRVGSELDEVLGDPLAVVMPSTREETAGLAAIEQMMRGRLVIASDIGGLSEVVDDTAMKFAPGDAAALADCMKQALDQPEMARTIGAAARDRAVRIFGQRRMVEEHLKLFRELLPPRHAEEARVHP